MAEIPTQFLAEAQSKLSTEQRVALARKQGARGFGNDLAEPDRIALQHVLNAIAADAEIRVRQALAESLAENPLAAHDLVFKLAHDDDQVAAPLLQLSEILTPDDLVGIIRSQASAPKLGAIASRRQVPETVCEALVDHGDEHSAAVLLRNPGAAIPETALVTIVDRYGEQEEIQSGLVDRQSLPATVMEKVIALVSAELLTRIVDRHALPVSLAATIVGDTRNRAILGLASGLPADAMTALVAQVSAEGRLTPSLLLRSLCAGNIEFVIHVIAERTMGGVDRVRRRVAIALPEELAELWHQAGLPAAIMPAFDAAVSILSESQAEGAKWDTTYYRRRIMARIITQCDAMDVAFSDEDTALLIASLGGAARLEDFAATATTGQRPPG